MKKLFYRVVSVAALCCIALAPFVFYGCDKGAPYEDSLVSLRSDLFEGYYGENKLTATYGFYLSGDNGANAERVYLLKIFLPVKSAPVGDYTVTVNIGGKSLNLPLALNEGIGKYVAEIEAPNFSEKAFDAVIRNSSDLQTVNFKSIVPMNVITYADALNKLAISQDKLLAAYTDESGNFTGKITLRVSVKDGKGFWYVGLESASGRLTAFLLDGVSGEVLAMREVYG